VKNRLTNLGPVARLIVVGILFCTSVSAAPKKASAHKGPPTSSATNTTNQEIIITMPSRPKPLLDTATVRKLYMDGDFEQAIEMLETGFKEKRPFNHNDSVFIFKHLGVMYAAKYETRERGKYFMHQLLMTEPTARIMDMYASDMIYMIFKNIQDEFDQTRGKLSRAEDHVSGNNQTGPKVDSPSANISPAPSNGHTLIWVGATTAVVAAGVAAFFILNEDPKSTTKNSSFQ
jgi:hypothetical protein